jgi:hypothetical protein
VARRARGTRVTACHPARACHPVPDARACLRAPRPWSLWRCGISLVVTVGAVQDLGLRGATGELS